MENGSTPRELWRDLASFNSSHRDTNHQKSRPSVTLCNTAIERRRQQQQ